jgi:hypothetical protein
MTNNSILLSLLFLLISLHSCSVYSISDSKLENDKIYGLVCPNPKYLATIAFEPEAKKDGYGEVSLNSNYTMKDCLDFAKKRHGNEVSIVNIRWDMRNSKRISAIFDVVKCD